MNRCNTKMKIYSDRSYRIDCLRYQHVSLYYKLPFSQRLTTQTKMIHFLLLVFIKCSGSKNCPFFCPRTYILSLKRKIKKLGGLLLGVCTSIIQ